MVHSFLGQRLIRHEWETSFSDVGLNKSLRIGSMLFPKRTIPDWGPRRKSSHKFIIIVIYHVIYMIIDIITFGPMAFIHNDYYLPSKLDTD